MQFDEKTLEMLRKNVRLDLRDHILVSEEIKEARQYQQGINQLDHCHVGVDYTRANQLEAELRFETWKRIWMSEWLKYYNYRDIDEYALEKLKQEDETRKTKRLFRRKSKPFI